MHLHFIEVVLRGGPVPPGFISIKWWGTSADLNSQGDVLLMFGRSWTSCTGDSVPKLRINLFNSHSNWCFLVTIDEMLGPRECFISKHDLTIQVSIDFEGLTVFFCFR